MEQAEITLLISVSSTEQQAWRPTHRCHFITDFISQSVFRHTLSTSFSTHRHLTSINQHTERRVHRHRNVRRYAEKIAFVWRHILRWVVNCPTAALWQQYLQQNGHTVFLNNNVIKVCSNIISHNQETRITSWDTAERDHAMTSLINGDSA